MSKLVQRILEMVFVLSLIWVLLNTNGCNAVHGFGEDLQTVTSPYVNE